MIISIFGTGYVGLVTAACFAELGHIVTCIDVDEKRIAFLKNGNIPFYEPKLHDIVVSNIEKGRLIFTNDGSGDVTKSHLVFICVGTPPMKDGSVNLSYINNVAEKIGVVLRNADTKRVLSELPRQRIIVIKSTVPVGTSEKIESIIKQYYNNKNCPLAVVSNPEFLREGSAVDDFFNPDRIIVGTSSEWAIASLKELYKPIIKSAVPFIWLDSRSAEFSKYAANVMLAGRLSMINELANACSKLGADMRLVCEAISCDERIGSKYLNPGIGYGGSCLSKDVRGLIHQGRECGCEMDILKKVEEVNNMQPHNLVEMLVKHYGGLNNVNGLKIAIWGLSFKPDTDDIRDSRATILINELLAMGCRVNAYDPLAINNMKEILPKIAYYDQKLEAIRDCDGLIVATDYAEFKDPDFIQMKKIMKNNVIFDGRNIYNRNELSKYGFYYYCIGLPFLK